MSSASWTVEQRLKSMGTGASDSSSGATDLAEARMSTAAVEMTSQRALMAAISGGSASRTSGEEAGRAPPPEGAGGSPGTPQALPPGEPGRARDQEGPRTQAGPGLAKKRRCNENGEWMDHE